MKAAQKLQSSSPILALVDELFRLGARLVSYIPPVSSKTREVNRK